MTVLSNNNVLQAAEEKIEANLLPKNKANYMKVVVAGLKIGMAKGPQGYLAQLKDSKDPIGDSAKGAVNLAFLLFKQTRGTMPIEAMVPAAMTLMLHALDFVDKTGTMKIGNDELVKATHIFSNMVFRNLNISPQMLRKAHESVEKVTQDPKHMEAMSRKAGLVKAPNSSTPTEVPEETDAV